MAYANWGAFVYKNRERQPRWEDTTPYHEQELEPGHYQVFLRGRDKQFSPHHAVLGDKAVRFCGYKNYPSLFVSGEKVEMGSYKTTEGESWDDNTYEGEIEGYKFKAEQYSGNMIRLYLKEPDGTDWTATCGYCYGAGWMD